MGITVDSGNTAAFGKRIGTGLAQPDSNAAAKLRTALRSSTPENPRQADGPSAGGTNTTRVASPPVNNMTESKRRGDALERDFRAAQEHQREPDLTTARNNLAQHLEDDYIPRLEQRQTTLGTQLHLASEHGQDTSDIRSRYDDNAAELERARGLLDDATGVPIDAQQAGVLDLGQGFDLQNPPLSFDAKVTTPDGGLVTVSVKASDNTTLGPNGEQMRNLEISREAAVGVAGEGEVGAVGGRSEVYGGQALNYSVSIPESHYQKVLAGDAPFPNPGDLSTLPPGSSAIVTREGLVGSELEGSLGAFEVKASRDQSTGTAVGIQVLDENKVRVMAGPTAAVTDSAAVGLGFEVGPEQFKVGGKVELGSSSTLRDTELKFVEIDRQSGGQAYADFLRTGEVPAASVTGVGQGGTIRQQDASSSVSIGGEIVVGPLEVGADLIDGASHRGQHIIIEYNDGSTEVTTQSSTSNGIGRFYQLDLDASGNKVSEQRGLLFDDVDSSYGQAFQRIFGAGAPSGEFDGQLELSSAQYRALREDAFEYLGRTGGYSEEQIENFRQGRDADGLFNGQQLPGDNPIVAALIDNPTPGEFNQAVTANPTLTQNDAIGHFSQLHAILERDGAFDVDASAFTG